MQTDQPQTILVNRSVSSQTATPAAADAVGTRPTGYLLANPRATFILLSLIGVLFVALITTALIASGKLGDLTIGGVLGESAADRAEQDTKETLNELAEIYYLPSENPTVATVVDAAKLRQENKEFYEDAENGDKLIIFTNEQLAILYRREEKRIINISPITLNNPEPSSDDTTN